MNLINTPYYLVDEKKLLRNLKIIRRVRAVSGAKSVLALKCFSTWCVFPLMREYMDGTTSSSLFEARLGYEKFGKEVHAYSVGFSREDIKAVRRYADKIIFNSISQLKMYYRNVCGRKLGLRVNPGISYSHFDLADPARKYSRLGVADKAKLLNAKIRAQVALLLKYGMANGTWQSTLTPEQGAELFYSLIVATAMEQTFSLPQLSNDERWDIVATSIFGHKVEAASHA